MANIKLSAELKAYFSRIGRKGGLKGGKAVWANLTPTQRTEKARKTVSARWTKGRAKTAHS